MIGNGIKLLIVKQTEFTHQISSGTMSKLALKIWSCILVTYLDHQKPEHPYYVLKILMKEEKKKDFTMWDINFRKWHVYVKLC